MIQVAKIIGTGIATTGLIGIDMSIGVVFGALILGVVINPFITGQFFVYAILAFCFLRSYRIICFNDGFLTFICYLNLKYFLSRRYILKVGITINSGDRGYLL